MRLSVGGLELEATSVGGVETCYQLPQLGVCLDIGRCPDGAERQATLLLTHAHIDHAAGLAYYVSMRGLMGAPPPRVFCPASAHPALSTILEAWSTLQADTQRCTLTGVRPGDELPLGKTTFARVFRSPHRIATVGYTLCQRIKKLRPELAGSTQDEIAARARAGEAVTEEHILPLLCFPGDTMIDVVETEPTVTAARVLLLECTFLGTQVDPERARRSGHIHLDHIAARAELFANEVVVLTHFSRRYSRSEIEAEVAAKLPASLRARTVLLLEDEVVAAPQSSPP
jgi:ribonuclease Z